MFAPRATALLRAKDTELADARAGGGGAGSAAAAAELDAARQLLSEVSVLRCCKPLKLND